MVRPVARIPLPRHRAYAEAGGVASPADGGVSYSLRLRARLSGSGGPFVRLDLYHFDDTNPTEDPESVILRTRELPIEVARDGQWHEVVLEIPAEIFADVGGLEVNALLLNLGLAPPKSEECTWLVDDLQFIEWRRAADLPDTYQAVDALRTESGVAASLVIEQIGAE
jgi:hypothetical protein